jgi:lysophospholipase L1-like esterase
MLLTLTASAAYAFAADGTQPVSCLSAAPVRIVALGDSTTATARDWAPEIQEVYADCLPGALARRGISAVVFNAGIGDTTTREAVARLDRDVLRHHPNLVVVQFGINDSWIDVDADKTRPRLSRPEYRDNLRTIIQRVRNVGATVVLMTPNSMRWEDPYYIKAFTDHPGLLDVKDMQGVDRLLELYAQDMRDVAKSESVPLVDIYEAFERYGQVPGQSIDDLLLAGDGFHPNQAGQRLVCKLLSDRIAEILEHASPGGAAAR